MSHAVKESGWTSCCGAGGSAVHLNLGRWDGERPKSSDKQPAECVSDIIASLPTLATPIGRAADCVAGAMKLMRMPSPPAHPNKTGCRSEGTRIWSAGNCSRRSPRF